MILKRLFDLVVAFVALVVLSPVMLVLAIMIRRRLGSLVVSCRSRSVLHSGLLSLPRFRSMTGCRALMVGLE